MILMALFCSIGTGLFVFRIWNGQATVLDAAMSLVSAALLGWYAARRNRLRPGSLRASVWFMAKPGERRSYASPVPYSPAFAEAQRKDGYRIFRLTFSLPKDFDASEKEMGAELEEI